MAVNIFHLMWNIPVCSWLCTLQQASSQLHAVFVPSLDPESGRASCKLSQGCHPATCHSSPPSQQNGFSPLYPLSTYAPSLLRYPLTTMQRVAGNCFQQEFAWNARITTFPNYIFKVAWAALKVCCHGRLLSLKALMALEGLVCQLQKSAIRLIFVVVAALMSGPQEGGRDVQWLSSHWQTWKGNIFQTFLVLASRFDFICHL